MFIKTVQAGVISEAPSLNEIVVGALKAVLTFVGTLTVLMIIIYGIIYITSTGNKNQSDLARKTLFGSIAGLIIVLLSLAVVKVIVDIL